MLPPTTTTAETLNALRVVQGSFLLCTLLYILVMRLNPSAPGKPIDPLLPVVFGAIGIALLVSAVSVRSKKANPALATLRVKSDDPISLSQWRGGAIISLCLCESIVLFGVAIHFIGGTVLQVAPFFIVGAGTMSVWWPTQP